jgi:predicted phosphodiesterase
MRVAIVSDIHANLPAAQAVAEDLAAQRIDEVWCLGDVVGYGGHPREALEWVEKRAVVTVMGNHDHAVATGDVEGFNPIAAAAARNHAQALTPSERARLHDLPLSARRSVKLGVEEKGGEALLVHASPDDPLHEYVYPTVARREAARWRERAHADIILLGHTHVPFATVLGPPPVPAWRVDGFEEAQLLEDGLAVAPSATSAASAARLHARPILVVNPGSVGQPRDGDTRAAYAVLDLREKRVELRRVAYDVDAAAAAIRAARLDPFLAQRLYRGA